MIAEKIELVLVKRKMTKLALAELLNWSKSNIYKKFKNNTFSEKEIEAIAEVLNCTFEASFTLNDTQEKF